MTRNPLFWLIALLIPAFTAWTLREFRRDPDRRRALPLAGLRAASAILLAWMVLQPKWVRREEVLEKPLVGVLVDVSQSMNDGPANSTRAMAAREWMDSAAFRKAAETCDLRYFAIDRGLTETVPDGILFNGSGSRIGSALTEWTGRWAAEGAAGLVLISDGLDTEGALAQRIEVPCWVMEVEAPANVAASRIAVWQVEPPRRPVAGAETSVRVVLQGWGVEGREIPVELWSGDQKVGVKSTRFSHRGEVAEILLPLRPERPGTYPYEIRVADPAADPSAKSQPFVITVRQEGRSVLLLSNTIGFEGKFLRRALTTDRNVRLDAFARWQDGRWASFGDGAQAASNSLDLTQSGLASRSAVVISDVSPDALNPAQWQALADYVSNGGGLVVLGGPNLLGSAQSSSVLGPVLPVPTPAPHRDGRFGVKLTDAGLRHPVFGPLFETVAAFPALNGANLATGVAGNAQVLMETVADGQSRPLVVVKQQGSGRVMVVLSDTLWRWRVASPGWTGRLSAYDTFWGQLLDWLAPDQEGLQGAGRIELTTEKPFHRQGDKVSVFAEWIGKGATPFDALEGTVKSPGAASRNIGFSPAAWTNADGRAVKGFRGEALADATGVHQVEVRATWKGGEANAELRFAVAASPEERRGEAPDAEFLKQTAQLSGGGYFALGAGDDWLEKLPQAVRRSERGIVTDIWNHPLAVAILLGLLCCEWWLRRRRGLV